MAAAAFAPIIGRLSKKVLGALEPKRRDRELT
jgi:hypothetical protein